MGDIEEEYLEGIEKEEELFLEGLKNNKNLAELEEKYSKKVKEIRRIYEKSLKKDLYSKDEIKNLKKKENNVKEVDEFKAKEFELEKNKIEKTKIKLESANYKISRKIKNFFYKFIPNKSIYFVHKLKISLRAIHKTFKIRLKRVITKILNNLNTVWVYIKEGFMKVVSEIKRASLYFKKNKKDNKKEDNAQKEEKKDEDGNKE